jgi:hypothetical protein
MCRDTPISIQPHCPCQYGDYQSRRHGLSSSSVGTATLVHSSIAPARKDPALPSPISYVRSTIWISARQRRVLKLTAARNRPNRR